MEADISFNKSSFIKTSKEDIQPKEIGRGSSSIVIKGRERGVSHQLRAIKIMPKKLMKSSESITHETDILKKLDHPNTIRLFQIFEDESNIYLVTDLCEGGELFDKLQSVGSFSQAQAQRIFRQVLDILKYLHIHKICHRDIKAQNFLYLSKQSSNLKLVDFGLSIQWKKNMEEEIISKRQNKIAGTTYYIAPQMLTGKYDEKCDIWSAGVLLYMLVSGHPPFNGQSDFEILEVIKKQNYTFNIPEFKKVSSQLKDLIKKILVPRQERISLDHIYEHPWMKIKQSQQSLPINYKQIKQYAKASKFKKITTTFIASQLNENQIGKLSELFKQVDTNHDGQITVEQLKTYLKKQHYSVSLTELKQLIEHLDADHNGSLNYTQFLACTLDKSIVSSQQYLKRVFNKIDKNGNGTVQKQQLAQWFQNNNKHKLNGKQIDQLIKCCDTNGDGKIDFNQFVAEMKK